MLSESQRKALSLKEQGLSGREAARQMGISYSTYRNHVRAADHKLENSAQLDSGIKEVTDKFGINDPALHSGWVHREDPATGEWVSAYFLIDRNGERVDLTDAIPHALENAYRKSDYATPKLPSSKGENLMVVDVADLHIGKLCSKAETGFTYNGAEAIRRAKYGLESMLRRAKAFGVGHILFVMGNDKLHFDTPGRTTTSGTPQDSDTNIFDMYRDAFCCDVELIDMCRAVAPTTLAHCPSNHDWVMGFCLAQQLQTHYRNCPEVIVSDYYMSERHRKYFVFNGALIGLTHGDGAKDKDLSNLMMLEAREHLSSCPYKFWYTHHLHHKVRKSPLLQVEKDHIGMTIVGARGPASPDEVTIEVVRSPSPPDGWHDRNGYINQQAVEAFFHDVEGRQFARLTEWI
jgi:hypothetical protein